MTVITADGTATNRPVPKPKPESMRIPAWSEVVMLKDRYVGYKGFADRLASRSNNTAAINRALVDAARVREEMDELYFRWRGGV